MRSLWKEEIIKGQMAAFKTEAAQTWGGLQAGRGTPASQAARQGAGGGRSSWTAPGGRPEAPGDTGASSGPQTGHPALAGCQDRRGWTGPRRLCAPLQWGLAYPPHLRVGASAGRVSGGRKMVVGWCLLLPPGTREGPCLSAWLVGDACASGSGLRWGREPRAAESLHPGLEGGGRVGGGQAGSALSGLWPAGQSTAHEPPLPRVPPASYAQGLGTPVYTRVAEEKVSPDCCWLSSLEPQVSPPRPCLQWARPFRPAFCRVGTGGCSCGLPQPQSLDLQAQQGRLPH